MSGKVWIPYSVNSMLTHQWEELKVVKRSACSCFHPTWKSTSHAMATKMLQTTSWVHVCSLGWVQRNKWMLVRSMGCVHTHWRKPTIEGCGSSSYIWSVMEIIGEDNWKVGKIGRTISQAPTPRPEHDKIQAWWASSILSKNMLKKVWWCKCSKMEFKKWTICCQMNCSKREKHIRAKGYKRLHVISRCCYRLTLWLQEGKDVG